MTDKIPQIDRYTAMMAPHPYVQFLSDRDSSEGAQLRTSYQVANKINWREKQEEEWEDEKSRQLAKEMKREADRNFKNETLWHGTL